MKQLEETIRTFDKYAQQYFDKYTKYQPYIDSYRYLACMLPDSGEVLDLACGPGNVCKFLLAEKPQLKIHGIDLSPEMVRVAQLNFPTQRFELGDARNISTLSTRYDAIVAAFFLPYLSAEEVATFIREARAAIKPGGIFYLSTMEGDYAASGYQSNSSEDRVYIYFHQANKLLEQLQLSGFELIHTERKRFEQNGSPATTDLFIYARAKDK